MDEFGMMNRDGMNIPWAVRPDRNEILGVRGAGWAAARFFLLPTIAVVLGGKLVSKMGKV
jgi:hypothetical protein